MRVIELARSLVVRTAGGMSWSVPLIGRVLPIGRAPASTIWLDSLFVSYKHARIEQDGGQALLVDLGSRNGSLMNGVRVAHRAAIVGGAVVTIGDATIHISAAPDTGVYQAPPRPDDTLRIDHCSGKVFTGTMPLGDRLTEPEFALLRHLAEKRGQPCTSQELGNAIWGQERWDADMLHRLVHRLKRTLEPNPLCPRYLHTVPWIGYRLTA